MAFLAAMSCVMSCGPYWTKPGVNGTMNSPGTWYVCVDLPEAQLPEAHKAVEMWDGALNQWVHIKSLDGGNHSTCRVWVHQVTEANKSSPGALAWANTIGGNEVSMMQGRYERDITGILLHELGHAFGAQHVGMTLMDPHWSVGAFTCPDRITVVQIAAWNHINIDLFRWCYY